MIGLASRGKSFSGLAGYLTLGAQRNDPDRVAWSQTRNLASQNPDTAAHIMKATAGLSKRVQKPVYHLIISWDEKDAPTQEQMAGVMDSALDRLGLADHQALYVAHNDTDHQHLHAMVNRVNEDTGRAWAGKKDRYTLRQALVEKEREYGFRETPESNERGSSIKGHEMALSVRENRDVGRELSKAGMKKMRTDLRHTFETSTSWRDLEQRLTRRGLELRVAGNGMRIFRDDKYAKLSQVLPPKMNAKKLAKRLGDFSEYMKEKHKREAELKARGLKRKRDRRNDRER